MLAVLHQLRMSVSARKSSSSFFLFCLLFQLFQSDLSSFFISPVPVLLFRCWPRQAIKIKAQVRHVIFSLFYFIAAMLWKRLCQTLLSPASFYCGTVAMWGLQIKCAVDGSRFLCVLEVVGYGASKRGTQVKQVLVLWVRYANVECIQYLVFAV